MTMNSNSELPIESIEEQRRLLDLFPVVKDREETLEDLFACAHWLCARLASRGSTRDDGPLDADIRTSARQSLSALSKSLDRVYQQFLSLDDPASHDFSRQLRFRKRVRRWPETDDPLIEATEYVKLLADAAAHVKQLYVGRSEIRRVAPAKEAVKTLTGIWTLQTGAPPTRRVGTVNSISVAEGRPYGPFFELCQAVVGQCYNVFEEPTPSLDDIIKEVLKDRSGNFGE